MTVISDRVWCAHQHICELRHMAETTFLALGEALYDFKRRRDYRVLGHPTFESYIADPDVDLTRSLAYRLIRVYEVFQLELKRPPGGLLEAGHSKLELIAPHIDDSSADEWIEKAAALSRSDLREELREAFGDDAVPPLPTDYRLWARTWKRKAKQLYRERRRYANQRRVERSY